MAEWLTWMGSGIRENWWVVSGGFFGNFFCPYHKIIPHIWPSGLSGWITRVRWHLLAFSGTLVEDFNGRWMDYRWIMKLTNLNDSWNKATPLLLRTSVGHTWVMDFPIQRSISHGRVSRLVLRTSGVKGCTENTRGNAENVGAHQADDL